MMFSQKLNLEDTAILHNDGSITYNEVFALQGQLKKTLFDKKLAFLICTNTWESLVIYVNMINMGVPVVLLSSQISMELLNSYISTYSPDYLIAQKIFCHLDYKIQDSIGRYHIAIRTSNLECGDIDSSIAVLIPTSGSTGNPQLVMLSVENLKSNAMSIIESLKMVKTERAITSLPMNYSFGLSIINTHFLIGASIVVTDKSVSERSFWDLVKKHNVTTLAGVPFSFNALIKMSSKQLKEYGIKKMLQAGGKLSNESIELMHLKAKDAGIAFFVMYGQTEATARIAVLDNEEIADHIGSVGKAIPGVSVWIQDANGLKIEGPNIEGEICVAGSNVFLGYANHYDDLTSMQERQNILITGDLGYLDQDNFLYITGRRKRIAKVAGIRINLDDLDQFMRQLGITGASISIEDKICVFAENFEKLQIPHLKIANYLNIHQNLIFFRGIESLPRNDAGKIKYQELESFLNSKFTC
jgi:long-chain acyl-CoA synthetase